MLNNILIDYRIFKKNKTIWFLLSVLILLIIYSMIFSYNNVERLDRQINNAISNNSIEEIDISQPLNLLNEFIKGIQPIGIINNNLIIITMVGSIIFGMIGSIIVGYEFKYRTMQIRASHFGWSQTITGKLIILFLLSVLLVIFVTILSFIEGKFIIYWANKNLYHTEKLETDLININIFSQLITAVCSLNFYGTLGLLFSLITRSTLIGGVISFSIPYLEGFFSNLSIEKFFPTSWIGKL
ncbi:hypothetical protein ACFCYN_24700, partial [Gottfriedia sp. NPDC056225]|uniref:hypothetical protein n=1 Tax=Gottfriedia sp. NPDC056225 TaxID=3345751 RepID=UPI0035E0F915